MKTALRSLAFLLLFAAPALAGPQAAFGPATASRVGEKLVVLWQGAYWPAVVIGDDGHGRVRIHYDNYGAEWDEDVGPDRIRHETVNTTPGRELFVTWGGALWPAAVVREDHGRYLIHYLGWGKEWDETIGLDRMRWLIGERALAPRHAFARGERVDIEWHGTYWAGVVTAVPAPDRFTVHYDGYGPEWDETVGEVRLRAR